MNEVMEHYRFFMRKQEFSEPFDKFYADLRNVIKSCDLGTTEEKLLRTQIVLGISDKDLQSKLLREDLNLDKVIRHCQATEQAEINRKILVQENETKIEVMEKKKPNKPNKYNSSRWTMEKQQQNQKEFKQEGGENFRKMLRENGHVSAHKYKFNCTKCGKTHSINECPAYSKNCNICRL